MAALCLVVVQECSQVTKDHVATLSMLPSPKEMTVQTVQAGKHPRSEYTRQELRKAQEAVTVPSPLARIIIVFKHVSIKWAGYIALSVFLGMCAL